MQSVMPSLSCTLVSAHVRQYFLHLFLWFYEYLLLLARGPRRVFSKISVQGENFLETVLEQGHGAIIYGPGMGNILYYIGFIAQRYPLLVVTSDQLYIRMIAELGSLPGTDVTISSPDATDCTARMKRHLSANGVVLLLAESDAAVSVKHTVIEEHLLIDALTFWHGQASIIPFCGYRLDRLSHKVAFGPLMFAKDCEDPLSATLARREAVDLMTALVQYQPHQWPRWNKNGA
jgi:hypothetical protein